MKWMYGITTVPDRLQTTFPRTLQSLNAAGFPFPRLFVDQARNHSDYREFGLETTYRLPGVRTFGNWWMGLLELYIREPTADRYAMFQDDFITYRNLRPYLESIPYPERGYCNLYTFPVNQAIAPANPGWFASRQNGKGAVALVFNRDAVTTLLSNRGFVERPKDLRRGHKNVDGGVVTAMRKEQWKEFCHSPSLVQHIGDVSSMGNRAHPKSPSFRGEDFDAMELLCVPKLVLEPLSASH